MKSIDFDCLTGKELLDHAAICEAFKEYLMDVLDYFEGEADFVIRSDFKDPYSAPYIMQEYEGTYTIGGKRYKVCSCHTDFCVCDLFHLADKPPFEFYMFFDLDTLPDETVGSHRQAVKKYLLA